MDWLIGAKEGDKFRWNDSGDICLITEIKDGGSRVMYDIVSGPRSGQWGYTILPQDVELLSILDELAEL